MITVVLVGVLLIVQTTVFVLVLLKMLKRFEKTLEVAEKKTAEVEQRLRETRQIVEQERKELSERRMAARKAGEGASVFGTAVAPCEGPHETSGGARAVGGTEDQREPSAQERQGAAFAEAEMAAEAFGRQCCIEAYFHGRIAQLMGHRQIQGLLSNIRIAWRQMGYRSEKGLVHPGFDELQSSIGRAMIRIDAKHDEELGYACLRELAEGGNRLARDFLGECGRE